MENKPYQVRYLPVAYEDLEKIDDYIAVTLGNPAAADRLMEKMEREINQLRDFPYIGSETEDSYLAAKGYRRLVVDNYMVFYLVSDERREVFVMRVCYGAREYRNFL